MNSVYIECRLDLQNCMATVFLGIEILFNVM